MMSPAARQLARTLLIAVVLVAPACGGDSSGVEPTPEVKITVTPADLVLTSGASASLEATVQDAEGRPVPGRVVQWSSTAPEVVSVSSTGMVTALAVGRASILAHIENSVGSARVVVQLNFRIPVVARSRWLVVTEIGTPAAECAGNEGGLRVDGGRDCTHSDISRYSLDLADADQWTGALPASPAPSVIAAAEGTIIDVCLEPPTQVTCGPNGPFVLVEHAAGFTSFYSHLDPSSVTLRRKTPVRQGQLLGVMGGWGTEPAPWLHFEVRHDNMGAAAAAVLGELEISGRRMREYAAGTVQ
jgi:Peptidase family M23/Bacterial Ig-like domain (group 2)